jgi:hypothetical protein
VRDLQSLADSDDLNGIDRSVCMCVFIVMQANGQRDTNPGSVHICTRTRTAMRASSYEIACMAKGFSFMQMVVKQKGHGKKIRGSKTALLFLALSFLVVNCLSLVVVFGSPTLAFVDRRDGPCTAACNLYLVMNHLLTRFVPSVYVCMCVCV